MAALLRLGREAVLRSLLESRRLVQGRELGYLLHRVYLDDYCLWVRGPVGRRRGSLPLRGGVTVARR